MSEKKVPMDSDVPELKNVALIPEATPRPCAEPVGHPPRHGSGGEEPD